MLKSVRNALKGVVAVFFVAVMVLAFAFFDLPELQSFAQRSAIRVGDQGVAAADIQREFDRFLRSQRAQTGEAFSREDAVASGAPAQIVESLAIRSVIEQEAERIGLAMPRSLVREILSADERFQNPKTGKFDLSVLQNILQNYEFTVPEFERTIRRELLRDQLIESLAGPRRAPAPMLDPLIMRIIEKRDVAYLNVTEDMAGIPEEPSPEKLRQFYQDNPDTFSKPEYRTFTVLSVRRSDLIAGLEAPEDELRKLYEAQKSRLYEKPETRTLYQFAFDSESRAAAAAAALGAGTAIEAVAAEAGLSLDAITFTDIQRDVILDPAVAAAAFAPDLAAGGVSAPVKGLFGWTVVKVDSVTAPETTSFEDAREDLRTRYLEADVDKRLYDALEAIEEARDAGADLTAAAEAAGGKTSVYGPVDSFSFSPDGAVVEGVKGEELAEAYRLGEAETSEAVEYDGEDGYFYIALDTITPAALSPYEAIETDVETAWRADERTRRISRAVKQIRDALTAGATLAEAATPFNAKPVSVTIGRDDATGAFAPSLLEQVFMADIGAAVSGPAPATIGPGAQSVVVVGKAAYDASKLNPVIEQNFAENFGAQLDQEILDAYLAALRTDYNVRVDQTQIDALFAVQP